MKNYGPAVDRRSRRARRRGDQKSPFSPPNGLLVLLIAPTSVKEGDLMAQVGDVGRAAVAERRPASGRP
ncbi:hypothetical protein V6Z11_D09G091100 [Gossypium hirsutum]